MSASQLIRVIDTTLDRHFAVSPREEDSIASSSWQCISRFDIIVRIRTLRKECDIAWGNHTEFSFARRRPEQTHKTTYLLYRYCPKLSILTATLTANLQTRRNGCGQFACGAGRKPPANTRALRPERLPPYTRRPFPAMVLSRQTLPSITDRKEPWTNITAN